MRRLNSPTGRRGFTVVELLVVISIIALLFALLVPAVARARTASRDALCLGNLRQLGAAFQAYRDQYDAFPFPARTDTSQWWSDKIYPLVYGSSPSLERPRDYAWIKGSIFECPAASTLELPPGEVPLWRSYGMSARLNDRYDGVGDYRNEFKHPNEVLTPGETTLLIDCTQQWSGTIVTATPAPSNNQLAHVQEAAGRHNKSLNVLYVDLHAASRRLDSIPTVHASAEWQIFWAGI